MKYREIVAQKNRERQSKIMQTQLDNFEKASKIIAESWKNKNNVWIFSSAGCDIITQEAHFRAGGFVHMNALYSPYGEFSVRPLPIMWDSEKLEGLIRFTWQREKFNKGDIMILYSPAGCSKLIMEAVHICKEVGISVVAITNIALSKQCETTSADGKRLYEMADAFIDTCGDEQYGVLQLQNGERICGGDHVMGVFSIHLLHIAVAAQLTNLGVKAPILRSVNKENAASYNSSLIAEYQNQIHYPCMQGKYNTYYQSTGK